tara:strand:- start:240 stop:479 length:240 start_codon:yes stop_codon:yes gene_type:complete
MNGFNSVKSWLAELTEIGLLLVALGVVIQILFGVENTQFIGNVTNNLTTLIGSLGSQGLVGLIAIVVILYLLSKRQTSA